MVQNKFEKFGGVWTALVTPFKNGQVDFASFKKLIRHQLDGGIQGFVVNGTTAESPTLTENERCQIFNFVKAETSNEIPLLMGTGSFSTASTIQQSQQAEKMKADGCLVVTPYYNRPPQRGLIEHFRAVADSVGVPIVMYNVPGRTAVTMDVATVAALSKHQNIVGLKEASGDLSYGRDVLGAVSRDFMLVSGDDGTFVEFVLNGGRGVISVLSHVIPRVCRELTDSALKKEKAASSEFEKYKNLNRMIFEEANPIPVKAALHLMGILESDEMRLPLVSCDRDLKRRLEAEMRNLDIV